MARCPAHKMSLRKKDGEDAHCFSPRTKVGFTYREI